MCVYESTEDHLSSNTTASYFLVQKYMKHVLTHETWLISYTFILTMLQKLTLCRLAFLLVWKAELETEQENLIVHWFTLEMATRTKVRAREIRCHGSHSGFTHGFKSPKWGPFYAAFISRKPVRNRAAETGTPILNTNVASGSPRKKVGFSKFTLKDSNELYRLFINKY